MQDKETDGFRQILAVVGIGAAIVLSVGAYIVSDTVPEGHVGLQKAAFSGKYSDTLLAQGFSLNPLTKVFNLRAQQFPVEVKDLRPKDKDGTLFEDMDVTVFVRLKTDNPAAVTSYLRTVGDVSYTDKGSMILGLSSIGKEARSAIPQAVNKFTSSQMLESRAPMEELAKVEVQKVLDTKYGRIFEVVDVNAYGMTYSASVEASVQAAAAKMSQQKVMEIEMAQVAQRKALMLQQFTTLKEVSAISGVSVDQILLSQQIAAMSDSAKYQMRSEPGKTAKIEVVSPVGTGPK